MSNIHTNLAVNDAADEGHASFWANNDNADSDLLNILLVEDDFGDAILAMRSLKSSQLPYNVDYITNGQEVMAYLKNCAQTRLPDIMFLDIGLPGTNGFDILAMLATAPAAIRAMPIVLITGYSHFDYLPKAYQLPIYGYINKPIQPGDLNGILSKVAHLR